VFCHEIYVSTKCPEQERRGLKHLHMRILEEEEEGEASKHNKTSEF
jgi:hypothetical protein